MAALSSNLFPEMPSLDHLHYTEYEHVYEPADDTFLLIDALTKEAESLRALMPGISLEIGSGSGVVTAHLSAVLRSGGSGAVCFTTDINPVANRMTLQTCEANRVPCVEAVRCDLSAAFRRRLRGKVDVIVFNPPYVPTDSEEVGSSGIEAAWAGGKHGREVIDRLLLMNVAELLTPHGRLYMVLVNENKPKEVARRLCEQGLGSATVVAARKAHNESLAIWRYQHLRNEN
mmetsp:Transcript_18799/g.34279  ORF Transcript_18799/g.34279 Transcript_18799/m.34279 type:complete len:231 (-) Transcript_18799:30-722(-)